MHSDHTEIMRFFTKSRSSQSTSSGARTESAGGDPGKGTSVTARYSHLRRKASPSSPPPEAYRDHTLAEYLGRPTPPKRTDQGLATSSSLPYLDFINGCFGHHDEAEHMAQQSGGVYLTGGVRGTDIRNASNQVDQETPTDSASGRKTNKRSSNFTKGLNRFFRFRREKPSGPEREGGIVAPNNTSETPEQATHHVAFTQGGARRDQSGAGSDNRESSHSEIRFSSSNHQSSSSLSDDEDSSSDYEEAISEFDYEDACSEFDYEDAPGEHFTQDATEHDSAEIHTTSSAAPEQATSIRKSWRREQARVTPLVVNVEEVNQETPTYLVSGRITNQRFSRFTNRLDFKKLFGIRRKKPSGPEREGEIAEPNNTPDQATRKVAGQEGFFYFLPSNGKLRRYDPTTDEILNTGLSGVENIKLGPDGRPYALLEAIKNGVPIGKVVRLERDGTLPEKKSDRLSIDVPNGLRDMAVAGRGAYMYTLNSEGHLHYHDLRATSPEAQTSSHPIDVAPGNPQAVAAASDGSVWVLDETGAAWRRQPTGSAAGGDDVEWKEMGGPSERLVGLETLPDGHVAGRDAKGHLYRPGLPGRNQEGGSWEPVPFEALSKSNFQRLDHALNPSNGAELITFLGGTASIRFLSKETFTRPWRAMKRTLKSVPRLYKDLKHFDYSKQQAQPMDRYNAQVAAFWEVLPTDTPPAFERLREMPDTLAVLDRSIGDGIRANAVDLLGQLIQDIKNPEIRDPLLEIPEGSSITGNDNVLVRIKNMREAIYGETDPAVQLLDELIKDGIFIDTKTTLYRGRTAEMIADHAILADAAAKLANLEGSDGEEHHQVINEARDMQERSLPHLVSRSGIAKTDPLGNAAQGFEAMQAILRQKNDMLERIVQEYAPALGWTSGEKPSAEETVPLFGRLINSMQPGTGLTLEKSANNGINTETFRLVCSGAIATFTGGVIATWLIPVIDIGKLKGVGMSINKTEDGVTFEFKRSRGKYVQLGARTGVGAVGLPEAGLPTKDGTFWGFGGWEIAVKAKRTKSTEDSISFSIKDDGNGNIGKVVSDVMSGLGDIFELMRQSEEVKSRRDQSTDWNLNVANVLVGATGVEQPNWTELGVEGDKNASVFKTLGAVVPELALDFGKKDKKSETTSSKGENTVSQTHQNFGLQSVRGNLIGVGVVESDYARLPLPGDVTIGGAENNPGMLGRAGVPSLLPGAILGKSFDRLSPTSKTVTLTSNAKGLPEGISVNLTVSRTRTLVKKIDKDGELRRQIPGLQQVLDTLLHQQGKKGFNHNKPITVSLELKPEVLSELPRSKEARLRAMTMLAEDLSNFRITGFSASREHAAKKIKAMPVPFWTREKGAKFATNIPLAKVDFVYDKQEVISHGESLLKSLVSFDDGAWGASSRADRLTQIVQQLENIVDALGQAPAAQEHGVSLEKVYQEQRAEIKNEFMQEVHALLADAVDPERLARAINALRTLASELDALRVRSHCAPFGGPAVVRSGPLFVKPAVGELDEKTNLKPHTMMDWTKTNEAIESLSEIDLSSLRGKKLQKAKEAVKQNIDDIKRTLNTITDMDSERKQELILQLYLLAARPSRPDQVEKVLGMLSSTLESSRSQSSDVDSESMFIY